MVKNPLKGGLSQCHFEHGSTRLMRVNPPPPKFQLQYSSSLFTGLDLKNVEFLDPELTSLNNPFHRIAFMCLTVSLVFMLNFVMSGLF